MNYRHAFHAGNFADVVKHAVVVPEGLTAEETFELFSKEGIGGPEAFHAALAAVLTAAGASLATVVKTTIFYTNVEDFPTINAIYARHMPDPPPARSGPANVALPRNLLISIEAIALVA